MNWRDCWLGLVFPFVKSVPLMDMGDSLHLIMVSLRPIHHEYNYPKLMNVINGPCNHAPMDRSHK